MQPHAQPPNSSQPPPRNPRGALHGHRQRHRSHRPGDAAGSAAGHGAAAASAAGSSARSAAPPSRWGVRFPYFTPSELDSPPSVVQRGWTLEQDRQKRRDVLTFISKLGERAALPNFVIATASVYFHTFFMRFAFADTGPSAPVAAAAAAAPPPPPPPPAGSYIGEEVGLAALFLASKVEEPRKRLADLITYFYEECRKQNVDFEVPHPSSQSFKTLKQAILNLEMLLLDAVEFNFNIKKPYDPLVDALTKLNDVAHAELKDQEKCRKVAWYFINDSYRSPYCLYYEPEEIAWAFLHQAFRYHGLQQPQGSLAGPWHRALFRKEGIELEAICEKIMHEAYNHESCARILAILRDKTPKAPRELPPRVGPPRTAGAPSSGAAPAAAAAAPAPVPVQASPPAAPAAEPAVPAAHPVAPAVAPSVPLAAVAVQAAAPVEVVRQAPDPVAAEPVAPSAGAPAADGETASRPSAAVAAAQAEPALRSSAAAGSPRKRAAATAADAMPAAPAAKRPGVKQMLPCPRCKALFDKAGYEAHKDGCKERFRLQLLQSDPRKRKADGTGEEPRVGGGSAAAESSAAPSAVSPAPPAPVEGGTRGTVTAVAAVPAEAAAAAAAAASASAPAEPVAPSAPPTQPPGRSPLVRPANDGVGEGGKAGE